MKWIFAIIVFCFFVVPAMGATLEEGITSEFDAQSELSPESAQALVVFDDLLDKLNVMAGNDATSGDPIIRLMDVFLEGGTSRQSETPFLADLMNSAINNVAADSAGIDECYGCASVYLFDSVATLLYLSSNIMSDDSVNLVENFDFVENLDYLKYLILEMESYGIGSYDSADSGYIDALHAAIDGWEEAHSSSENNAQAVAIFDDLLTTLNMMAESDVTSGDLFTKLTDVFLGESANGQSKTPFLTDLMSTAINNAAADSGGVGECYECASVYLFDSIATLFSIASYIINDDQVGFGENVSYLKNLVLEMQSYGGVDSGYIDAVQAAIDGWEEVYGTYTPTGVYISEEHLSDVLQR